MTGFFDSLSLDSAFLKNLSDLGYDEMTPIQAEAIPPILEGEDILAQAETGSGKTVAFGLGLIVRVNATKRYTQSLVLCPTRELADQVTHELRKLARTTPNVKIISLYGGVSLRPQMASLQHGAHIVVGTPGRILKHLDMETLEVSELETLIVDEAHRMLDMGFIDEIQHVISYCPTKRQTLLFSATYPEKIENLSNQIQKNPVNIIIEGRETPSLIDEHFYSATHEEKLTAVLGILETFKASRAMVFTNTKAQCREVADDLKKAGIDVAALHGDLEQYERIDKLVQFSQHSKAVLVATDMAARGLDIDDLEMVINYDMPFDEGVYSHRIGRTGRAGKQGQAFSLYTPKQAEHIQVYNDGNRYFNHLEYLKHSKGYTLNAPNSTIVIEGGKKNKIRPGDLLGALTGGKGIEGKQVGNISIYDRQSYVAIIRPLARKAQQHLKQGKIKGRRFSSWIMK